MNAKKQTFFPACQQCPSPCSKENIYKNNGTVEKNE